MAACGGLFRNQEAICIGCFAQNLGPNSSLFAELSGAMQAIKIAHNNGWLHLWFETDSLLVLQAFKSISIVRWRLRNRWDNRMILAENMNLIVTHIFREGNCCADKLANIGLTTDTFIWMDDIPIQVRADFTRNRLGLPCFRFVNF
jgi:ribonuclease HI